MDYTFSLTRTRLVIIIVGLFLLGNLIFSAGLVTGLYMNLPANPVPPSSNLTSSTPTPISTPTPAVVSTETKANNSTGKNDASSSTTKSTETKTQGAEVEKAADDKSRNPDKKKGFVVQVGKFAELPEAQLLVYELELKGYIPRISEIRDAERRVSYVVILGSYLYEADAKKAATLFSEQERVQAEAMLMNLF